MAKAQVTYNGETITVDLPDGYESPENLRDKYMLRSVVDDQYVLKREVDRRFKGWVKRDDAADDEELVAAVMERHGKPGKGPDLEAAKADWRKAELEPAKALADTLLKQVRGAAIRDAARAAGFDPRYVDAPANMPSYLETIFADRMQFDAELGYFVVTDTAGNRLAAAEPSTARPYSDPGQFFNQLAKETDWKPYLEPNRTNNGSGYAGGKGSAKSGYTDRRSMSTEQKLAAIKELGHEGYLKLPYGSD